jgi:hypothetical protein
MIANSTAPTDAGARAPRLLLAVLAASVSAVLVVEVARTGSGYWLLAVFGLGPDLALFLGFGAGLAKGQLHPRAVPAYNLLHRFSGPLVLAALSITGLLAPHLLIGALAWMLHVTLDRALGYGLRTRGGFQRA